MLRISYPNVLCWHQKQMANYAAMVKSYKSGNTQQISMLEDIVDATAIAVCSAAAASLAVPFGLSLLSKYCEKGSATLHNEADAHVHFQKVLSYYQQNPGSYELRCTYQGLTYVRQVDEKYVVFLNMKSKPKKATIQHEILHTLSDDMDYDPEYGSICGRAKNWLRYFFYAEPRVLLRVKRELLG